MSTDTNSRDDNAGIAGAAVKISDDPLIVYTSSRWDLPLGMAEPLGRMCPGMPAVFLVGLAFDCTNPADVSIRAEAMQSYRQRFPRHEIMFLGNTQAETAQLVEAGADAVFANENIFVSEHVFCPLPEIPIAFDAIYNARPSPDKRHDLAVEIKRVAYVTYATDRSKDWQSKSILSALVERGPSHVVINEIIDGLPKWMGKPAVNAALARSAVGLCLSAVEASMRASIEYLLAGLPVVSAPSSGGRDVFFDSDYCMIVAPNPRAVREAVEALRDRSIPRQYVRARTLAKLQSERHRFVALLEQIKARHGIARSYEMRWPFSDPELKKWKSIEDHARDMFRRE